MLIDSEHILLSVHSYSNDITGIYLKFYKLVLCYVINFLMLYHLKIFNETSWK